MNACELMCPVALVLALASLMYKRVVQIEVKDVELAKKREKIRKRYVLAQALSERPEAIEKDCVDDAVKDAVRKLYGEVGLALSKPKVVYLDEATKMVVVRTTLEGVKIVASALLELDELCGSPGGLIPLRAFGTLASAREKIPKFSKAFEHLQ